MIVHLGTERGGFVGITSGYGPRNRSPLKWSMWSRLSAIQTSDAELSAHVVVLPELFTTPLPPRRMARKPEWPFGPDSMGAAYQALSGLLNGLLMVFPASSSPWDATAASPMLLIGW